MLTAVGVPAIAANVTNTIASVPAMLVALWRRRGSGGQASRLWLTLPAGVIGDSSVVSLLLRTGEKLFRDLVPFIILLASLLLAIQDPAAGSQGAWEKGIGRHLERMSWLPVGLAAVYGGYFGRAQRDRAGCLGVTLEDNLTRLNALKQLIGFATNVAAAGFFLFSGQVVWLAAGVMAVGALLGGTLGVRLAGRAKPSTLRWIVVSIGVIVSVLYFTRG
jgi:uncharacterized membrane protein YfcA